MLNIYITSSSITMTFLAWGWDKFRPRHSSGERVPEKSLAGFSRDCRGPLGALAGMVLFRPKARKKTFWLLVRISLVAHVVICYPCLNPTRRWKFVSPSSGFDLLPCVPSGVTDQPVDREVLGGVVTSWHMAAPSAIPSLGICHSYRPS